MAEVLFRLIVTGVDEHRTTATVSPLLVGIDIE